MNVRGIVRGKARGTVVRSEKPINFLGEIDKDTGVVRGESNMSGRAVGGSILVFPYGVGSSVGAYTIYSLKSRGVAPLAMVCQKADMVVASGCALADIPLVIAGKTEYDSLKDGREAEIDVSAECATILY